MTSQASDTLGCSVIAHKEGSRLGGVVHVFFDPTSQQISGMTLKSKTFGKESWFSVEEIEVLGKDIILLKGEASITPVTDSGAVKGKSLKEMKGMRVVTDGGELLGTLDDLEIRGNDWTISELCLNDNRRLPVDSAAIKLGSDEVIVPAGYSERLLKVPKSGPGFLHRIFTDNVESTA